MFLVFGLESYENHGIIVRGSSAQRYECFLVLQRLKVHMFLHESLCGLGFPGGASGKEPTCQCRRHKELGLGLWVGKIP